MTAALALATETFPALAEMGITRFHEISRYTLRQDGPDKDVLKVHYKRQKGSLLPESRKYRFGRSLRTVIADGGTARLESTYEISPYLLSAVAELDRLVVDNGRIEPPARTAKGGATKAALLVELDRIERALAERLTPADAATVNARLAAVRHGVEAL